MASPNTPGQISSDAFTNIDPFEGLISSDAFTNIDPFEGVIAASTPPAESSTPPPESSSPTNHLPYHVFINHYGEDTKHTVADSIYKKLSPTGLRVFLDKNELQLGDFFPKALENAITSASIHIAIFSENYAKSPWCLAELELMMRLRLKVTFIPIFYLVEPSILRWAIEGKGIYGKAILDEYEKKRRYTTKLQSWKAALHIASFYSGEIIKKKRDEEAPLINVVELVLEKLKKNKVNVAQHPVGLDEIEQDFRKNIVFKSPVVPIQIVGIWGMGGAGKTTLAKHLYNKKCSTFKKSSFLFDIREAASRGQLHEKQKKLLQGLNFKNVSTDFDNKDVGKEILRSSLESVSVFIILDDVDHKDQLDDLLPAKESLGHGSLIIVTTRELRVLKAWNISDSDIYKIKALDPSYSEELFCWHAFGQPSPIIKFKELAKKFTGACCGLPLSLKVLGSLLCGESSEEYWQSQLEQLSRMLPEDIKSRLKISYDALDNEGKEMFLDVACFLIGWPSSTAIAAWEWNSLHSWKRLVNKCLVELDVYNNIRMHDHLRDLGREIANKQSPYRLWSKLQRLEIHPQQQAIQIRGMADAFGDNCYLRNGNVILNTTQGERTLAPGSLGLKILITDRDFINEECSELSRELVCFRHKRFAQKNLQSWLPLKKLRILQLDNAYELEDLWDCDEDGPPQLRQLLISEGYGLKKISTLQRLTSLETLTIYGCGGLKTLPSLAEATSLKQIDLLEFNKLEKIESLEGLTSLERLKIDGCTELKTLPSLAEATSLEQIDLSYCKKLEKIESLEGLTSLERLKIYRCTELKTLPSLAEATSLKQIDLSFCNKLEKIESLEGLTSLKSLEIYRCTELKTLPSLAETTSLKQICLLECNKLEKIESLEGLTSLKRLIIYGCTELKTFPSLAEATSLKQIDLSCCNKLEIKIESLEGLTSLEGLKIDRCTELKTLPSLAEATSLKQIDLLECNKLEKIESLEGLTSLEGLKIDRCTELKTLPSLAEATSLKQIDLLECNKLEKIESLEGLTSLEVLKIDRCTELKTLPSLAEVTSLKQIDLLECNKLEKIESLEGLTSLERLKIYRCTELKTLPSLAEATSLKQIDLSYCKKLEKIESLEGLTSLETLRIRNCHWRPFPVLQN